MFANTSAKPGKPRKTTIGFLIKNVLVAKLRFEETRDIEKTRFVITFNIICRETYIAIIGNISRNGY